MITKLKISPIYCKEKQNYGFNTLITVVSIRVYCNCKSLDIMTMYPDLKCVIIFKLTKEKIKIRRS